MRAYIAYRMWPAKMKTSPDWHAIRAGDILTAELEHNIKTKHPICDDESSSMRSLISYSEIGNQENTPRSFKRLIYRTNWPKHPFKLCSKPNNTMMTTTHNSLAHQEHERLASRDWEFLSRLLSFTARLIFCKWFIKCGSGKVMHCEASSRQKKIRMKIRG